MSRSRPRGGTPRLTFDGLGGRGAVGAEPWADGDLGGDGAEAEGVASSVAAVAEEQLVVAVAGAACVAEDGVVDGLARAGDGGRRVDGARAAHDVVHGAEAARRRGLRGRRRRALPPQLRRARRRRRAAAHGGGREGWGARGGAGSVLREKRGR